MKFQLVSDVHLEFYKRTPQFPVLGDVLVLAGDIGYAHSELLGTFLRECKQKYQSVYYVAGNHEFYNSSHSYGLSALRGYGGDNLTFLENESAELGNLRILGCTLWANVTPDKSHRVSDSFSDYRKILHKGRPLSVDDTNEFHRESLHFLEKELSDASKKTIVVTHHLPSHELISPKYRGEDNTGFASHCDYLFRNPVVLWVCGHSHAQLSTRINGIDAVLVSWGYPREMVSKGSPLMCTFDLEDSTLSWC
jgi:predicted phosphohydrolase